MASPEPAELTMSDELTADDLRLLTTRPHRRTAAENEEYKRDLRVLSVAARLDQGWRLTPPPQSGTGAVNGPSALGDRLRELARSAENYDSPVDAVCDAADFADTHEAAALAESAQGRGPHAAATFRWLAHEFRVRDVRQHGEATRDIMERLAREAGPT